MWSSYNESRRPSKGDSSPILWLLMITCIGSFAFHSPSVDARGTLLEPQKVEPSVEEMIDAAFGQVVGQMASVLLWDVAWWDNEDPLQMRSEISGGRPLADPLGWGVFMVHSNRVVFHGFDGEERSSYKHPGLDIDQVWFINDAQELLVRSVKGEIYIFQRTLKGASKALGPYRLPNGDWTAFAELNGQQIFGSSAGRLYRLSRETREEIKAQSWSEPNFNLNQTITRLSARQDGAYWLIIGVEGAVKVIKPLKEAQPNLIFKAEEVISFSRPIQVSGQLLNAGFTKDAIWVAFTEGLYTWNTRDGAPGFGIKLPSVSSVTPLLVSNNEGAERVIYLSTATQGPNHILSNTGDEVDLKLSQKHPFNSQISSLHRVNGMLWASHNGHIQSLSSAASTILEEKMKLVPTKAISAQRILQSGDHLITADEKRSILWQERDLKLPLIVLWLVFGAIFFTYKMRLVNVRLFRHAIEVVRGKYTDPASVGEVSHFQALTSALSATVGLGNIAGVAIAVSLGGPGATFWMIVAGFLGMASKFTECTLGQKYRTVSADGVVMGGAMHYLSKGLQTERNLPKLGKLLAVMFSFLCIGGSFGGGNAFQVKQSLEAVAEVIPALNDANWIYGLVMSIAVGVVILGGIKSIAQTAEKIVPAMCGLYILASLYVILVNVELVPQAFAEIIGGAFSPDALYGGAVGVLVVGFKRAAFSNEAGIGSAAIAHAAAKTEYPVREGAVALLEPFIDTIVVCTMTALVIVITGAYHNPEYGALIAGNKGAALTSQAMGEAISFFPYVLSVAVVLFAYSTMISWSYYGERCWAWLFGENPALFSMGKHASLIYRVIFLIFAFLGSIVTATNILDFSDLMILGMALPNIFGILFLVKGVRGDLDQYEEKLKAGEFPIFDPHAQEAEANEEAEAEGQAEG